MVLKKRAGDVPKKKRPKLKKRLLANPDVLGNAHNVSRDSDPDTPLTDKAWMMLKQYLMMDNPNIYQAYRMAGYEGIGQSGITASWEIFHAPNFQKQLEFEVELRKQGSKVELYTVVRNLLLMANANMDDYASWDSGEITLKNSTDLTRDQKYAIVEIKNTSQGVHIKLDSRQRATEMLATHLGFLVPDPSKSKDVQEAAVRIREAQLALEESVPTGPPEEETKSSKEEGEK